MQSKVFGRFFTFISSLLSPDASKPKYEESLDDLDQVIRWGRKHPIVMSLDAQDNICFPDNHEALELVRPDLVGNYAERGGSWKGVRILQRLHEWDLAAANTICPPTGSTWTCHYDLKQEPKQIDYMMVSKPLLHGASCPPQASTANDSDHVPIIFITAASDYEETKEFSFPKNIGFKICDDKIVQYNNEFLSSLGVYRASRANFDKRRAYHIFTDGSHEPGDKSSWAYVVFPEGGDPDGSEKPISTAAGITSLRGEPSYRGAAQHSSFTGEATALIEAFLFLLSDAAEHLGITESSSINVRTDSQVSIDFMRGAAKPDKSLELVVVLQFLFIRMRSYFWNFDVSWVEGHSGTYGNELADQYAKKARIEANYQELSLHVQFMRLRPDLLERELQAIQGSHQIPQVANNDSGCSASLCGAVAESVRTEQSASVQGHVHASQRDSEDHLDRQASLGLLPPYPTLMEASARVHQSAKKFAHYVAKPRPPKVPKDDPDRVPCKELERQRRVCTNQELNVRICKNIQKVRRKLDRRNKKLEAEWKSGNATHCWHNSFKARASNVDVPIKDEAGRHISNIIERLDKAADYFESKDDPHNSLPDWLLSKTFSAQDLDRLRGINLVTKRKACSSLSRGEDRAH